MQLSAAIFTAAVLLGGSGLVIKDLKKGHGVGAKDGDSISVKYVGKLKDGTVFDSTQKEGGKPFTITLGAHQVIPGWDKGLVGMKVGGKRRLTIPPDMAYGARGIPGVIPPNSTLIFDVDMVSIKAAGK